MTVKMYAKGVCVTVQDNNVENMKRKGFKAMDPEAVKKFRRKKKVSTKAPELSNREDGIELDKRGDE